MQRNHLNLIIKVSSVMAFVLATNLSQVYADDSAAPLVTPPIPGVVPGGIELRPIKSGFTGTEGPITLPDGSLIFTETQANRITKIGLDGSISSFINDSNGANGLAFAPNGDLYAAQTLKPSVGIIYPANRAKVLAKDYQGKPLGRPNDLVLDKKGGVYFTDPGVAPKPNEAPATKPAVYYIKPSGELILIADDITRPNGIQLSPDEKILYVANTAGEFVFAYDIAEDGSVGPRRKFALLEGFKKTENGPSSGADGLAVDAAGRLYVASTVGIQVFDKVGIALGIITLPKAPQNLAFAGADKKTLYVVGRGDAYKIPVLTPGYAGRAK
ncbi:MAG TPA: SMP-30/gluconolactonase/LRE family protein [Methylophilaceae bacterium]|jgi:gluconolactonase